MIPTPEQVIEDRALVDAALKRLWTFFETTEQSEFKLE